MSRRRLLLFGVPVAGLLVLGVGVWLLWPQKSPSEINQENAARIQMGMTLHEVEALLGGPARRESDGPIAADYGHFATVKDLDDHLRATIGMNKRGARLWRSNHALIWVEFDSDERVIELQWVPSRYQNVRLEWLGRWLRL